MIEGDSKNTIHWAMRTGNYYGDQLLILWKICDLGT